MGAPLVCGLVVVTAPMALSVSMICDDFAFAFASAASVCGTQPLALAFVCTAPSLAAAPVFEVQLVTQLLRLLPPVLVLVLVLLFAAAEQLAARASFALAFGNAAAATAA